MPGLDPRYVANDGKLTAGVPAPAAGRVLEALRTHPLGREATPIGRVGTDCRGQVLLCSRLGGELVVLLPAGE